MTQTLVRPSTLKAKKIKPSGPIGDPGTFVIHRRRTPGSLNSHQQFQLDRLIRSSACFCPSPFVLKRRDSTRYALTDNQRLHLRSRRRHHGHHQGARCDQHGLRHGEL